MKYKLYKGVTIEHVDGHNVLITERGDAAVLNETAEYILGLLLDGTDYEAVIQKTAKIYKLDRDIVSGDFEKLVRELMDKELIESD